MKKILKNLWKDSQNLCTREDRFEGLDIELTPNEQIIIPESLAWLGASVKERMECGDHWVIYAEVLHGNILKSDSLTAVHHRKTGASY